MLTEHAAEVVSNIQTTPVAPNSISTSETNKHYTRQDDEMHRASRDAGRLSHLSPDLHVL